MFGGGGDVNTHSSNSCCINVIEGGGMIIPIVEIAVVLIC